MANFGVPLPKVNLTAGGSLNAEVGVPYRVGRQLLGPTVPGLIWSPLNNPTFADAAPPRAMNSAAKGDDHRPRRASELRHLPPPS
jgi:hypothetical protein